MIALDTNILLRFLIRDDEQQWEIASRSIQEAKAKQESCYINLIVLCELVWVLKQSYKASRDQIADIIEDLLQSDTFEVENSAIVRTATKQFATSKADFADCLIGKLNKIVATETLTFDKKLKNLAEFKHIE